MDVLDLGEINDPMLIFGGPHSNLHAFEAFLDKAAALNIPPHRMISTGDVAAYCADAEACTQKLRKLGMPVLAGNCEKQLSQDAGDCGCGFGEGTTCDLLALRWYVHARTSISDVSRDWMAQCPDRIVFDHNDRRFVVIHGGASKINRFMFPATPYSEFETEVALLDDQIGHFDAVLAGHSGIAFVREINGVEWINPGALGLPENDGTPQTRYVLLSDGEAQIHKLDYDYKSAAEAMVTARLTQGYHETLISGYWPSQDVLPLEMRR